MKKDYTPAVFGCLVLGTLAGMAVALLTTAAPVAEARTPPGTAQRIFQELEDRCDCNTQVLVELELIIAELNVDCECEEDEPVCGNGVLEDEEACDDGNTDPGDGCSAECQLELGACCLEPLGCDENVTLFECEGEWQGPGSLCEDVCVVER